MAQDDASGMTVEATWQAAHRQGQRTLYVLGAGFDPRALVGIERYVAARGGSELRILLLNLASRDSDDVTQQLAVQNRQRLENLVDKSGSALFQMQFPSVLEVSSAGLILARSIIGEGHLEGIGDVIADVSALPSNIYFPVIGALLSYYDQEKSSANIQVVACENAELDEAIREEGLNPTAPIGGFKADLDMEATTDEKRIWAPVLGKAKGPAIEAIYSRLHPVEICPVLPFPARRPRLPDDILIEHRELLFTTMQVQPRNFIYAHETNPFDLYRQLSHLNTRYIETLKPLGPAHLVLSTHASKVLSLGVLLAAYEQHLPVLTASPTEYSLAEVDLGALAQKDRLVNLWLTGDPYSAD
jgi:hypothetical protein